ncbi:hypothetical protein B0H11DRAFT_1967180 [Mycena galericulata]|nr:hypothetical protein B0H11DRAFT_1967180 [Mycena galericulata]
MSSSHDAINRQFDRAVEIVQGLPKTGPIQTGYDEKLTMYRHQATVGNVTSPRPGIWDMLGRAKWDAWAKHKDLDPYEAKWLYVGALVKVLRKYSDRTVSADLIQELESYGGDPSNLVMSRTLSGSRGSDSSGSTTSDDHDALPSNYVQPRQIARPHAEEPETSEDETEDEADRVVPAIHELSVSQINRPPSSVSSNRYRTPMAGSLATSPPPVLHRVPESQPMPGFETPSAFGEPHSSFPPGSSYAGQFSESSRAELTSPPTLYPAHPQYRSQQMQPLPSRQYGVPSRPVSRPVLERAIENVQAHLAALSERIETLESLSGRLSRSRISASPRVGDDLGMWSLVANPVSRGIEALREAATFFARDEHRSPTLIIVRRLCLDVSFLLCVLAVIRALWRKSGVRRREVNAALVLLWRAIVGTKKPRTMVDRGV